MSSKVSKVLILPRWFSILVPYLWLLAFFLVPFFLVLKISFSESTIAIPPYFPVFDIAEGLEQFITGLKALSFENYIWLTEDDLYWLSYVSSVTIAFNSTLLILLVGYPLAYAMSRAPTTWRPMALNVGDYAILD